MTKSKLLTRQLKRAFTASPQELLDVCAGLVAASPDNPELARIGRALPSFVDAIDASYTQFNRDLDLRTRSLQISSTELTDAYQRKQEHANELAAALQSLRTIAATMASDAGVTPPVEDSIAALTQAMAEIAKARADAVAALRLSEERLQLAITTSGIGLWDWDIGCDVLFLSETWCAMLGYVVPELPTTSQAFEKVLAPEDLLRIRGLSTSQHRGQNDAPYSIEIPLICKDGATCWVQATGRVVSRDAQGLPLRMIGTHTNITLQKATAEAMRLAKDAAEAANRAKSDFLTNMSHELRTPMNGILGLTELCLETGLDEVQLDYLTMVYGSATSLMTIIDDVLDFSKIEAGKLTLEPTIFSLRELVDKITRTTALRAHEKKLELTVSIAADVPDYIVSDPLRIQQVLIKLLDNAIKFTATGKVALQLSCPSRKGDDLVLFFAVRDTGIGIPRSKFKVIFDSFAQADTSPTRRYGGTGLGLTIANRLIGLLRGTLAVASSEGSGSVFSFSLPCQCAVNQSPAE